MVVGLLVVDPGTPRSAATAHRCSPCHLNTTPTQASSVAENSGASAATCVGENVLGEGR